MERLELWFVAGTAEGAGEGREQGSRLMRITFIARRAAVLAIVVTALLAPAAAQADILTNWGDSGTVSHDVRGIAVEGVDTAGIKVRKNAESPAGFCWVDQPSGKRSIAWTRGTARPLSAREFCRERIHASDLLHLDGHQTQAALAAAKTARKHGVCVSIDAETRVPDN